MLFAFPEGALTSVERRCFAIVDVETTGVDPLHDAVVEVAVVRVEPDGSDTTFASLVDPGRPISPGAMAVHGITDSDVRGAARLSDLAPRLRELTRGATVVAHVARFDRSFLPILHDRRWLCTMRLARKLFPSAPRYTNAALREYLNVVDARIEGRQAHRALTDALITRHVLAACLARWDAFDDRRGGEDLIAFAERPQRLSSFWFGEHRGVPMPSVPSEYLDWILSDGGIEDLDIRHTARIELERRCRELERAAISA